MYRFYKMVKNHQVPRNWHGMMGVKKNLIILVANFAMLFRFF